MLNLKHSPAKAIQMKSTQAQNLGAGHAIHRTGAGALVMLVGFILWTRTSRCVNYSMPPRSTIPSLHSYGWKMSKLRMMLMKPWDEQNQDMAEHFPGKFTDQLQLLNLPVKQWGTIFVANSRVVFQQGQATTQKHNWSLSWKWEH